MPRPPNPHAKTPQLIIRAENEDEKNVINGVKHVCALDGLEYKKELLQLCRLFLQKHNYPPGNPQTQIMAYADLGKTERKCGRKHCDCLAVGRAEAKNGWKGFLCADHYEQSRNARLLRKWKEI